MKIDVGVQTMVLRTLLPKKEYFSDLSGQCTPTDDFDF